jgi:hypothetical protein
MNVNDLVPTLATCSRIPGDAFGETAFVWAAACGEKIVLIREGLTDEAVLCPAPTLEEIIKGHLKMRVQPYCGGDLEEKDRVATGLAVLLGEATSLLGRRSAIMEVCEYADIANPDFDKSHRSAAEAALLAWLRMKEAEKDGETRHANAGR